jgi:hypothetical protein
MWDRRWRTGNVRRQGQIRTRGIDRACPQASAECRTYRQATALALRKTSNERRVRVYGAADPSCANDQLMLPGTKQRAFG